MRMTYQIHQLAASGARRWRRGQEPDEAHDGEDADVARDLGKVEGAQEAQGEGVGPAQEQGIEAEDGEATCSWSPRRNR